MRTHVTDLGIGVDSPGDLTRASFEFARRLAREPFVHFVLLGTVLFFVNHHLEEQSRFTRIAITRQQVQGIAENYRLQYGGLPSVQQLDALVNNFIREEIFYHEALKLGLDADDEIIRRRLVQKYEFLQQDLATPTAPTQSQLLDYYHEHLDQYRRPQTVTFTHVYFSTDGRGENRARDAAQSLASSLNLRGLSRAVDDGDRFPGPYDFTALSRDELARVFGKEGLAQGIFEVEPNHWSQPLRSGLGWHTVHVSAREPGRQATFDEARDDVRRDYIQSERDRRNAETIAKLRRSFVIVRE
jgi:peptidyl-prolyl cis-trans isomerase C